MGYETKETDLLLGRFVKWLIIIKCHYQNDDLALIFITIGNHLFSRMYLQCWDFFLKFFSALPSIDFNELKLFHRQSGTALIIVWLINKLCPGIFFSFSCQTWTLVTFKMLLKKSLDYICFIKRFWRSLPKSDVYDSGPAYFVLNFKCQ